MIGIVTYGMGNVGSVRRKLDILKIPAVISNEVKTLATCDKLILPGVGHFSNAVKDLKNKGLWDFLNEQVLTKRIPVLGICLGMQLMATHSEEGNANGFGWFDAEIIRFRIRNTAKYKIPHIGWNNVNLKNGNPLFSDVDMQAGFYFVHSYHIICNDSSDPIAETIYEYPFVSAVNKNNIFGVQFHPEKSHNTGAQLLKNFISI